MLLDNIKYYEQKFESLQRLEEFYDLLSEIELEWGALHGEAGIAKLLFWEWFRHPEQYMEEIETIKTTHRLFVENAKTISRGLGKTKVLQELYKLKRGIMSRYPHLFAPSQFGELNE